MVTEQFIQDLQWLYAIHKVSSMQNGSARSPRLQSMQDLLAVEWGMPVPDSISSYTSISHDQSNPQQDSDSLLYEGASQLRHCLRRQEESDPVHRGTQAMGKAVWVWVDKKNQADYVKYHTFQTVPEYFEELDM